MGTFLNLTVRLLPLLVAFVACSNLKSLDYNNDRFSMYEDYLKTNVQRKNIYLRLRETANAKILRASPRLTELQELIVPGFAISTVSATTRLFVSLEMPDWARFNINDFKFLLDGALAKSVKEVMDGQLLQTLYPFAVPHDRAFIVDFEGENGRDLRIQTSQGEFKFEVGAQ